ncbi:hypothetical protein [Microbacterium sp. 16-032]|uniref:hypothetical protein n=1 Tax=Microbacterium sp. 16-032 TaxID=3239808 RepID=UPI0034E229AD
MTGEQLGQDRVRADTARQTAQQARMTTDDIAASYLPQIDALTRPRRTSNTPD